MTEPKDEALREFESAANKTAIERQHAMEDAQRTCLKLRIEIEQLNAEKVRADKAESLLKQAQFEFLEADRAREKAEADAVGLRDTLRRLIPFAQSYRSHPFRNPEDKLDSVLDKCQHALSADCGRGHILKSELDKTIYVLKSVLIYDKLAGIDSVKDEITRLEQLK